MEFWASSECYKDASTALERARDWVEPYLNAAFAASSLARLDCKLRYVPIAMPEGYLREKYTARSKLCKKERIWDCAPQLDYDIFLRSVLDKESFEPQIREYLREIALSGPQLVKLGATKQQIEDFDRIMAAAVGDILLAKEEYAQDYHDSLK